MHEGKQEWYILIRESAPEDDVSKPFPSRHANEMILIGGVNTPKCLDDWHQNDYAHYEWNSDSFHSVPRDKAKTLSLDNKQRKKTGEHVEQGHAKLENEKCDTLIDRVAVVIASVKKQPTF